MTYADNKKECAELGYVKTDTDGLDVCGPGGGLCSGHSCLSKKYWNKEHKQPGWYKERALERTGLGEEFRKEMHA